MPVKVTNNMKRFRKQVEKRSVQFVASAISVGATWSKFYAPVAYSTLVNSQQTRTFQTFDGVSGSVSFSVSYAIHLEGTDTSPANWSPKKPPKYGNEKRGIPRANAWNPNAKPGFLKAGFEDPQPQAEIDRLKTIFKF
jgi:hypothetical protein